MTITEIVNNFHWIRPLWLIALLPTALVFFWLLKTQRSSHLWQRFIDPALAEHLLDNTANRRASRNRVLPLAATAIASCLAIIAIAGPSWEKLPEPVVKQENALVIIADLTLSMHAQDTAPSRLVRMRYKILELLKQRKEGQTALVAYSGDAHIVSPLTDDANNITALVPALTPEVMPSIGSNAKAAFELTRELLESQNNTNNTIVWLTDQILPRDKTALTQLINATNSRLVVIGIGTTNGGPVPLPSGKFLTDASGTQVVTARLDKSKLQLAAQQAGGKYLDIQSSNADVDYILKLTDNIANTDENPAHQQQFQSDQWRDLGGYLALVLLPVALFSFRRGWLLTIVFCLASLPSFTGFTGIGISTAQAQTIDANGIAEPTSATASAPLSSTTQPPQHTSPQSGWLRSGWKNLWQTKNQQGADYLSQGDHSRAAESFIDPAWQGVSNYRGQQYQQSLGNFEQALADSLADPKKSAFDKAADHYNLGHALARSGKLEEAVESYNRALAENPEMENAKKAKSIVESLLEQQQEQQQQQQGNQSNDQQQDQQQNSQQQSEQQESDQNNQQQAGNESDSESNSDDNSSQQPASDQQSPQPENDTTEHNEEASVADSEEQEQSEKEEEDNRSSMADDKQSDPESEQKASTQEQALNAEQQAQLQQWLRKIEDDPSGLLRRKFKYERQQREREGNVVDQSEDGQLW